MAWIKKQTDEANGVVQFEISENAQSVDFRFNGLNDADYDGLAVRVELLSKNKANQTLYGGKFSDLKKVLAFAYPNMRNILPFAIGKSLVVNDDNKLLITISNAVALGEDSKFNGFEYSINTYVETTNNPLVIKRVSIDEEIDFSTEFYPLLMVPVESVESYETVVMVQNSAGALVPSKVVFGKQLIQSSKQVGHSYLAVVTSQDQKVKLVGSGNAYLILI